MGKYVLKGRDEMAKDSKGTCFAPAAVGRGGKIISQLPVSLQFLGGELGMGPPVSLQYEALKCALDIADIWSEIYAKRKDAKSWAEVDEFVVTRLKKWLECLAHSMQVFGDGKGPFFFGKKPTYVDFSLYNMLRNFEGMYGQKRLKQLSAFAPNVIGVYEALHTSKQLETFVKTERPILYASVMHDGKMPLNS